ncbi:KamA family radical SAM protein [Phaeodactylibacter luteus]|uniref:Lysine 2,3-aminomutase n=1 Tax=Phaeodactylibacter luteus TaxID=1564516 RepID=A0A5C6S1Q9_9BACT|nr:lysine 2,3-aminomutase [Phaeodactylibacter luteus]TXB68323.1 lysine 2,3-aminomutase [Phaeodactylibacter luteus]
MSKYQSYTLRNFRDIPQIQRHLTEEERFDIEVVGNVLPFKANNYVVEQLIDWSSYQDDPIYILTFPQKDMLQPAHYEEMAKAIRSGARKPELKLIANKIRMELNPHPAGQRSQNVPQVEGTELTGVQHKYRETMLFFPSQGQTCHAYCTFCFRWPQFVGMNELKFAMRDTELVIKYLRAHPKVTDILFTGGDPLIMKTKIIDAYVQALIDAKLPNLRTIRFGTKALGYWPQRFTQDDDADSLLRTFENARKAGIHIAFMAHFNSPAELQTEAVKTAIGRVLNTGAIIRTQSPVMRKINDSAAAWASMWQQQVALGCIPYYFFVARDTGAQDYFAVPLERAWHIFRNAYQQVSGIARTVRGPSMSAGPGKVHIVGVSEVQGEKVFTLQFLQGRNPDWVARPFFAKYDPKAIWLDELQPAFGAKRFFFEDEYPLIRPAKATAKPAANLLKSPAMN